MLRITGGGEHGSRNCHCFCPESFFPAPSFSGKRKLPQTRCPSVSERVSLPAAAPVLCTPSVGKPSPRELWGEKKTSSALRFFSSKLFNFSIERAVNGSRLNSSRVCSCPAATKSCAGYPSYKWNYWVSISCGIELKKKRWEVFPWLKAAEHHRDGFRGQGGRGRETADGMSSLLAFSFHKSLTRLDGMATQWTGYWEMNWSAGGLYIHVCV